MAVCAAGCVEPFGGANVQITFESGVQTAAPIGVQPTLGRPPADTMYQLYSISYELARDANGDVILDTDGEPIIDRSFSFHVVDFEVRPHVSLTSPCFIELEGDRFPGLHVTEVAAKTRQVTGIADPLNPPTNAEEGDIIDVIGANDRLANLGAIAGSVKTVTSASTARPPTTDIGCLEDGTDTDLGLVPPPTCTGDQSNMRRLTLCRAYWEANPTAYEGSDKVFTVPLNGLSFGHVTGLNPVNNAPLGGTSFLVDFAFVDFDAVAINWQYKDLDQDGQPDFPATLPIEERSLVGFHYMAGEPESRIRGTVSVPLENRIFPAIAAEATIVPDLGDDDVQF
jgi:hypothetical protein